MSALTINLSHSVRERLEEIADQDGVEVSQYINNLISQRVAVSYAESYVQKRAKRGSREMLREILHSAPDVEPEEYDKVR